MVTRMSAACSRPRRSGEHGFTLIELLVSVVVLSIIGGAIATLFSVAETTLKPGGPQTRLLGSYNLEALEKDLGQDGARASCIQVPPLGTKYGSCTATKFGLVSCPIADLCFGWPQVSDSSCHVADYTVGSGTAAKRTEYVAVAGAGTALSVATLTRADAVNVTLGTLTTVTPTGEAYTWVRALPVTITSSGLSNAPSQTLVLHPVSTDPAGTTAQITSGGSPC